MEASWHFHYNSPYYCTEFDLKATISNAGPGWARHLYLRSSMPRVVGTTGKPISFALTEVTINGHPWDNVLNLELGDLPPGENIVIVWKLVASEPGRFVSFAAEYRQVNPENLPIPPALHRVTAKLVHTSCRAPVIPEDWPWCFDDDRCFSGGIPGTQGAAGGPINTRNGTYDYAFSDISLPTLAGNLSFEHLYSTKAIASDTALLGHGWTHNLDTHLVLPDSPGGEAGVVRFKALSSNRYEFYLAEDGSYYPFPGMCGALTQTGNGYQITDNAQWVYTFDSGGRLIRMENAQGHALHYEYDGASGLLHKVGDDGDTRYLTFAYDSQGRISSVRDHTNRQVGFGYDLTSGDLITATDVLDQPWTYRYDDPAHPHFLTEAIDPRGVTVERTEFDAEGRAVRQYNGNDEFVVELVYHGDGTVTLTDALANSTTHHYRFRADRSGQQYWSGATTIARCPAVRL